MLNRIRTEPALVAALVQTILGLLVAFGLELTGEQTAAILAVTGAILAIVVRQRVTPVAKPKPKRPDDGAAVPLAVWVLGGIALALVILALVGHPARIG